jgi:hypothetical protein
MNTNAQTKSQPELTILPKPKGPSYQEPFRIIPYRRPRTGETSWRVTGHKRNGQRVRKNFTEQKAAEAERLSLTTEYLTGHTTTELQATKLTADQLRLAETAFARLGDDEDLLPAITYWLQHGKAASVKSTVRLDDAFEQFKTWLETTDELRDLSKANLRRRVNVFVNSTPNHFLSDITPDAIKAYLADRNISAKSKDNDRRALSSFFAWCIESPRKWAAINPCR